MQIPHYFMINRYSFHDSLGNFLLPLGYLRNLFIIDFSESSQVLAPHLLPGSLSSLYLGNFLRSVLFSLILLVSYTEIFSGHHQLLSLYAYFSI